MNDRERPPEIPPGPPTYVYHKTCAVCWEAFGYSMFGQAFDNWRHRRNYGHDPVDLWPPLDEAVRHERNLRDAERWRRWKRR